jgi:DNA-3-methyladenine glycosylase II
VYLLFALGRPDIWPSGDLALAVAMQRLKRLRRRPDPKRLIRLAEPWRPYRGVAAHFLWHYYAKAPPI